MAVGEEATERKRCAFYNEKKKRNCKMEPVSGQDFCGLHFRAAELRVQCPHGTQ